MFIASIALFFVFSYKPFVHCPMDGDVPCITTCIKAFQEQKSEEYNVTTEDIQTSYANYDDDDETKKIQN